MKTRMVVQSNHPNAKAREPASQGMDELNERLRIAGLRRGQASIR